MITKLPDEFLDVIRNNNGLKMYLSNLSRGKDATPRSWLYESWSTDKILNTWLDSLNRLKSGNNFEKNVFHFDISQLAKWGPQGKVDPINDLLHDIVLPTFADASPTKLQAFSTTEWKTAKNTVADYLMRHNVRALRPASYSNVVADMRARDTLESNSGWPDFTRRKKPEVLSAAITAASDGKWAEYPAIALFRNYNQKTRLVWMFPESTNIYEGSFCQPIQSRIVNSDLPFYAPWKGFDSVRMLITNEYNSGKYLSASDFSNTDAHFQLTTTEQVFDVLKKLFVRNETSKLWASLERMHNIPLIIGSDEMITGEHGVSSGSNWTNFIETVFDHILSEFVYAKTQGNTRSLCAIGDDMCWTSNGYDEDLHQKLEQYGMQVGQVINKEKVTNELSQVKFLQRLFQRGYSRSDGLIRGVYSTVRALKSIVFPERFYKPDDWSGDMFCARTYMILENCVDHPLFEQFVKYVVDGHKDLVPFAKQRAGVLDKITRETKLLPGFNPSYNAEKRDSSLSSFASISVARNL